MSTPVQDRTADWVVDHQIQSPLYCSLPLEVRLIIFELAMEEYYHDPIRHNFRIRHDHDLEPGNDGVFDSSVESARFTDEDPGDDSEYETDEDEDEDEVLTDFISSMGNEEDDEGEYESDDSDDDWTPKIDGDSSITTPSPTYSPINLVSSMKKYRLSWLRPGCLGAPELRSPLILVCRRIYLETRDMIPANFTLHIWSNYAPRETQSEAYDATISLYRRLTPPQRNDINSAHLHCNELFKKGPKCLWSLCAEPPNLLRRIEYLRISILVPSMPFPAFWDPYCPDLGSNTLRANMASTADFGSGPPPPESPDAEWEPPVQWNEHAWAESFRYLPRLKTLIMDFDTDPSGVSDMRELAEWASRVWRFPLGPRPDGFTYLSVQGNPVEKMSWRGTPCFNRPWYMHSQTQPEDTEEAWSADRIHLLEKGYGERMYTWTLTWTARIGRPWDPSRKGGKEHVGSGGPPTGKTTWDGTEMI
ncbi:uncharacterized protein DNG_02093 [Cephalotrichum gorgonifer]|uniref:Uncharacterized protein n=1 Tax=Cephalotrichum gorgonifer TaxID=2041049 RepID=A0AAE8MUK4_9PEZI|nr:uncharacterized protein DNG_02093 [Cephalotrichum gorgonifer]